MDTVPICGGRYSATADGRIFSHLTDRFLSPGINSKGYCTVQIYDGSIPKKPKSQLVHRLVASAFFGASEMQVNHKDGVKTNNSISNLEFVTQSENIKHAMASGAYCGERHVNAKLTNDQVRQIRFSTLSVSEIAIEFRISQRHVRDILSGNRRSKF